MSHFKELQAKLKLTNEKLALRLQVTQRTVERWRGNNNDEPPYTTMLVMQSFVSGKGVRHHEEKK
jgi:DNA-binding transcriptional regulator YiaG